MSYALVIVESPAKAKTIAGYLGKGFQVESSIGHVRDLPMRAADVPESHKHFKWAKLGIDVENDFEPLYVVSPDKKQQIAKLRKLLKGADQLFLATDEDREGEAIAWHLLSLLKPKVPVHRMVFHEITKNAITEALDNTREIDQGLVDAQETRRLLDRLYGFELSPVLWRKIAPRLSAGRVQSVATRIVVERERERMAFSSAGYWSLNAELTTPTPETFSAALLEVKGRRVAGSQHFDDAGAVTSPEVTVLDEAAAVALSSALANESLTVESVKPKPYSRRPAAPFITSTFQQAAGGRLKMSSLRAMRAAQNLYQKGYVTYMRTDSTTLSDTALRAARAVIADQFGGEYLPPAPRTYKNKVRNAQEAHEAIRPAGDQFRDPQEVAAEVSRDEAMIYEMIWQRTVASQMTDVVGETVQIRLTGQSGEAPLEMVSKAPVLFATSGTIISHLGFRKVYAGSSDENEQVVLPQVSEGDRVQIADLVPEGHTTQPPSRFTEASLIKKLEELGVGRPSTYASIMETIQNKDYAWKKGSALVPTFSAFAVTTLLETHFPKLVDYNFTALMEDDLDEISRGEAQRVPWLRDFYFGTDGEEGLHDKVTHRLDDIDAKGVSTVILGAHGGQEVMACFGRFGTYVQKGEESRSIPDDIPPDELTVAAAMEFLDAPTEQHLGDDPVTGLPVIAKSGKFGPYVSLGRLPAPIKRSPELIALTGVGLRSKEIKVALSYLRLAVDPVDEKVVRHIANIPKRGIGKGTLDKISDFAVGHDVDFLTAMGKAENSGVTGAGLKGVRSFLRLRKKLMGVVEQGPGAVVSEAVGGYRRELGAKELDRQENLDRLVEALGAFTGVDDVLEQLDSLATVEEGPKPKMASLFSTMSLERITLEDALELLSLPRTVGVDPSDGVAITVQNGPFGPYLKKEHAEKSNETRNIDSEERLLTVTLEECLVLLAQPKAFGRRAAKPPLRELGKDPASGNIVTLKDGNYGPYVSDGEYNASLGRGDSVESLTDERAAELLAERRAKGPAKKNKQRRKRK